MMSFVCANAPPNHQAKLSNQLQRMRTTAGLSNQEALLKKTTPNDVRGGGPRRRQGLHGGKGFGRVRGYAVEKDLGEQQGCGTASGGTFKKQKP